MNLLKKILFYCAGIILFLNFIGCSPSSRSQRYNKPDNNKEEKNRPGHERFSKSEEEKNVVVNNLPDNNDSEFDELPVEENPVDKSKFIEKYEKLKDFNVPLTYREKILVEVIK